MQQRPPSLLGAAGVQAADALIVLVASVLAGVDTVSGKSYQQGSGIALTLIGLATAAALVWVAVGLSQGRRWSRTPAALTQLFVGIVGIYLVQGHRYAWGIPSLVLAAAGFVLLLTPASLRALAGPRDEGGPGPQAPRAKTAPPKAPSAKTGSAKAPSAKTGSAKSGSTKTGSAKAASAKTGSAKAGPAKAGPAKPRTPAKPGQPGKRPARG
jgi:hypothetical protein